MGTLLIAVAAFFGFILAYHTYGRWLSGKIFGLDKDANVPSHELQDNIDFVPTKKEVIFGHHFTSIAGTGPIVGPAIAVLWGWLPALLWVVFGSIFIGAVHDFGALVVSLRNRGQTIGEVAGRIISPRARILFLLILFFSLTIVLAIFGLVIATIFKNYPYAIVPVWISLPIAIGVGIWVYKFNGSHWVASLIGLAVIYVSICLSTYYLDALAIKGYGGFFNGTVIWTILLLVYCYIASVLPVWILLQPRDFINSHQLLMTLGLVVIGLVVACLTGSANMVESAPAVVKSSEMPIGAPPIWPFLFITIACGAVSGFHCLVSSGTSSKQIENEKDAKFVGYGAMLLEGALAVVVILACCAGVGMGKFEKEADSNQYTIAKSEKGEEIRGAAAWNARYRPHEDSKWGDFRLGAKVGAFVDGGANFLSAVGVPVKLGMCLIAVLVAGFAATTLDTATRLQRYVIQEIGQTMSIAPARNKYIATLIAVVFGGLIAAVPALKTADGSPIYGSGGFLLWPLFGATNQLLAGLAFMVTLFYLWRRNKPIWFALIPMVIMLIMPAWAMLWNMFHAPTYSGSEMVATGGWFFQLQKSWHLFLFGCVIIGLQIWMIVEGFLIWPKARGVLEEQLPPLERAPNDLTEVGGRSC